MNQLEVLDSEVLETATFVDGSFVWGSDTGTNIVRACSFTEFFNRTTALCEPCQEVNFGTTSMMQVECVSCSQMWRQAIASEEDLVTIEGDTSIVVDA